VYVHICIVCYPCGVTINDDDDDDDDDRTFALQLYLCQGFKLRAEIQWKNMNWTLIAVISTINTNLRFNPLGCV